MKCLFSESKHLKAKMIRKYNYAEQKEPAVTEY
jgi:hypothetical protein